ncbi:conserved hypothetical protein [Neospora caninum Liverpool]|uniref:Diphthamide biosynthesis protein 2,putative n=1 Tax=Neospora caninum (strain Liverpool) TaxID=572307 RepID=F0VPP0_NEOCL|nr:conserved hypothetical protein [Neospora caninum Liverpool]CBZ55687.1 conserved hypothetical protein [Neospora caninum Liverpool]CEL70429.1 TPA: Diphthamide biosynthesis protein 2,putative [Neospora caninum Liverpool]|eukprot:XP_003885713.1 conserved hypothetical protein [Neospora caninum Liverpool]
MVREALPACPAPGGPGSLLLPSGTVETLLRRTCLGGVRVPCPLCSSVACSSCTCFALPPSAPSRASAAAKRPSCGGVHAPVEGAPVWTRSREPADDFFQVDDLVSLLHRNVSWTRVAVQLPTEMLGETPWLSRRLRNACKRSAPQEPLNLANPAAGEGASDPETEESLVPPGALDASGASPGKSPGPAGSETEDQLRKRIKMGTQADDAKQGGKGDQTGEDLAPGKGKRSESTSEGDAQGRFPAGCTQAVCDKGTLEAARSAPGAPTFFLLGDTVHSNCCADQIAAAHIEPHALVHYGYACLSWPVTGPPCPVLYRYTSLPLNVSHFSCSLCRHLKVFREQRLAAYRQQLATLGRAASPQSRSAGGADASPSRGSGRAPLASVPPLSVSSAVLGDGLSLSAALQSCMSLRGRIPQVPLSTFRPVSTLPGAFCQAYACPLILVYDVRYHYALPCILQHIASLFLAPSPPSSVSTTPPLSSPASATPPLHALRDPSRFAGEFSESGAYSSGTSSPSVDAGYTDDDNSLQAAADALAAAERQDASDARVERGRREETPPRTTEQFPVDAFLRLGEGGGSRMAVVGNAMPAGAVREASPLRDGDWRHCSPSPSAASCARMMGSGASDWQLTSLCVALAPSACLPSKDYDVGALEPCVLPGSALGEETEAPRKAQRVAAEDEERELDPPELQRRQFSSLVISFGSAQPSAKSQGDVASPAGAESAGSTAASAAPPTWFFSLPFSWTPRLVFLGPQLHPVQRLVQQQASGKGKGGISVRAAGASLRISLSAYTAVAGRFVFQVLYRSFDRTIGLAPVLPLSASLRGVPCLKSPSRARDGPEFVPIEEALGACGWGDGVARERGDICLLYVGPTVETSPTDEQSAQAAGSARFTYESAAHPSVYSYATAFGSSAAEGPGKSGGAADVGTGTGRAFEGNETLAGWQAYREMRGKLAPPPLLHRLLLRYGGVDRLQLLSYDPTFFTGTPNQEHLVKQFQRLQVFDQQRDEEDAELFLSPDTTADEAEDLPEEGSRRRPMSSVHISERRPGGHSLASRQEEELTALDGVGEDEKEYFRSSLCILDESDRAASALQKQYSRVSSLAETTNCTALLLLGPQVYGQPGVLDYVQRQLQKREGEARHVVRIAMGEVTPAKLLNFEEVDSACLFGCPELCLRLQQEQKARGLPQLLVLPVDALAATDGAFSWSPARQPIEADELSQQIALHLGCAPAEIEARVRESSGEKREESETAVAGRDPQAEGAGNQPEKDGVSKEKSSSWDLALRGGSDVLQCVLGQDVLAKAADRHFKGVSFGEEGTSEPGKHLPPAHEILQGLSGVASEYEKERPVSRPDGEKSGRE